MIGLRSRSTFIGRWGPAILMMALIFLFSSIPSNDLPNLGVFDFSFRKLGHTFGYFLLSMSFLWGIGEKKPKAYLWALMFSILYALSDEIHQSFVPGRSPRILDVGIDSLGSLIGLLVFHGEQSRRVRKN